MDKLSTLTAKVLPRRCRNSFGFNSLNENGLAEIIKPTALPWILTTLNSSKTILSPSAEPTLAELRVADTYWSDHCRHTTF